MSNLAVGVRGFKDGKKKKKKVKHLFPPWWNFQIFPPCHQDVLRAEPYFLPQPFCCLGSHQDNHGLLTLICFHGDRKAISAITEIRVLSAFVLFWKKLMQTIWRLGARCCSSRFFITATVSTSDIATYKTTVKLSERSPLPLLFLRACLQLQNESLKSTLVVENDKEYHGKW